MTVAPWMVNHSAACATEGGRWYACDCDGILFERGDGAPNRCHVCGMFARRFYDCTCEETQR